MSADLEQVATVHLQAAGKPVAALLAQTQCHVC